MLFNASLHPFTKAYTRGPPRVASSKAWGACVSSGALELRLYYGIGHSLHTLSCIMKDTVQFRAQLVFSLIEHKCNCFIFFVFVSSGMAYFVPPHIVGAHFLSECKELCVFIGSLLTLQLYTQNNRTFHFKLPISNVIKSASFAIVVCYFVS